MRRSLLLAGSLLLAAAAYFGWPREHALPASTVQAEDAPQARAELESEPEVLAQPSAALRASAETLRFEPLPADPSELVLRFITGDPERTLTGVEAWALELDEYEAYQGHLADVERELRERGHELECDAQGRAHLPLLARWWLVGARSGELFGAHSFEAGDAPEDALELFDSHECSVHTRSNAGRPLGGVPVLVTEGRGVVWQGTSDAAGELVIPNLGWLLADFGGDDRVWFVSAADGALEPPLARFERGAPLPRTVELVLAPASSLRLRVLASDGTPVALDGELSFWFSGADARLSEIRLGHRSTPPLPIRAGTALLPRVQAGARLDLCALLDGGRSVSGDLLVPDAPDEQEIPLRLAREEQVLRFTALDEQGRALAGRTLDWFTFDGTPDADPDVRLEPLHLDELGRGALVVERSGLAPSEPQPLPRTRAVLQLREGAALFETQPLRIEELGSGPVIDLGALRLEPAQPLVRGRVHDASGKGIARVSIGLELLRIVDGEGRSEELRARLPLRTDADGCFELFGSCPGGRAQLTVERTGYTLPEGVYTPEFECGTTATVDVTLVRTGVLRMSILTDASLRETYIWKMFGPDGEEREPRFPGESRGELTSEHGSMTPGSYRVLLVTGDPFAAPLVDAAGVEVRAGEITLDPRLLRVPLHELPADPPAPSSGPAQVELHIVDESGRALPDGSCTTWGGDNWSVSEFHGGVVALRADQVGRPVGLWAPGRRYRELDCPDHDATIVLQPAPRMRLHLDLPPAFAAAGICLRASLQGTECELSNVPDMWSGVEVDAHGEVLFECPVPCTYRLELTALRVDPAGWLDDGTSLETQSALEFTLADQPGEQIWKPAIRAEEWAALAQVLGVSR